MAALTGYKVLVNSVKTDLNAIFQPLTGASGPATKYKTTGGKDLNLVFLPYTSGTKTITTGYKIAGGIDLNSVFSPYVVPKAWYALGSGIRGGLIRVNALCFDSSNNLYIGGSFTSPGNYLAKWNGSSWSNVGGVNNTVYGIITDKSNNIYITGVFTLPATRIAKFNTSNSTWSSLGSGLDQPGYSLAVDTNNNLYVAGAFSTAGGSSAYYIAKWNPTTNSWSNVGSSLYISGVLSCVAVDLSNNLYTGGSRGTTENIFKFNSGNNTWSGLGLGFNSTVRCVTFDLSNNVYAGGNFTYVQNPSGNYVYTNYVAKWSPITNSWSELGSGLNSNCYTLSFDLSNNILYAGGQFSTAGGSSAVYIAKWSPSTNSWSDVGNGFRGGNFIVRTIGVDKNNNVYAGGDFFTANGTTTGATGIAVYK